MPSLSSYTVVMCTVAALSNAQHFHSHHWNHHSAPEAASSRSRPSTAPTSTPSVAIARPVSSTSSISGGSLTSSIAPNGIKAGVAGFPKIQITNKAALDTFAPHISWYSDYWPNTTDFSGGGKTIKGIGMLWGNGDLNETDPTAPIGDAAQGDKDRYDAFAKLPTSPGPEYMMGFYEPDWQAPYSSNMNPPTAAAAWKSTLGKLDKTLIGSPSMATQKDEDWLTPFMEALGVTEPPWDYTCIHTNKNSSKGVEEDVGYYWNKYKKPVWVSEFACVNDKDWTFCDQDTVNTFIAEVVGFFEKNGSVVAYGYSNGAGLGSVWPLIDGKTGGLTPSGTCYLNVLQGKSCTSA